MQCSWSCALPRHALSRLDFCPLSSIGLASSPVQSVNEEDDPSGMVGTVWLDCESRSGFAQPT